jgi:hypothetical protein
VRVIAIARRAAADSVKWKEVPAGVLLAVMAVSRFATRKRLLVKRAPLRVSSGDVLLTFVSPAGEIVTVVAVLLTLPRASTLLSVTV